MSELSPPNSEENDAQRGRSVATGALRRVFKSREKARNMDLRLSSEREDGSGSESDGHGRRVIPHTQNTSNHYTLNLPSAPTPQSDTPYILLGYVSVRTFCNVAHISFPVISSSSSTSLWFSSSCTSCYSSY